MQKKEEAAGEISCAAGPKQFVSRSRGEKNNMSTVEGVYPDSVSRGYRYYVFAVVWVVLLLRFVDIQIVAVLLEPIRSEFKVSDTQLGLLSGTMFAIFYATLGMPVAWMAERFSRKRIIAVCLGFWSAMTACCGLVGTFGMLLLSRLGVGVGEAGGAPPSYSLVSDYFPAKHRSTVFAGLSTAVPVGVFSGFLIGGFISHRIGWRAAFVAMGIFGVLVAILVQTTIREPRRGAVDSETALPAPGAIETCRYLLRKATFRHFVLAATLATLGASGSGIWIASFFIRVHHFDGQKVATWLAFIYGGGGLLGAFLGGWIADRLSRLRVDNRWQAWVPAITMISILPFSLFVYLWPNGVTALLVHTGTTILMHTWMGPTNGTIQNVAGPSRRAMAAALNLLVVNLLALGCGPLLVGALSDGFKELFGDESLRYSILGLVVLAYSWASLHFLLASRTIREDLARTYVTK